MEIDMKTRFIVLGVIALVTSATVILVSASYLGIIVADFVGVFSTIIGVSLLFILCSYPFTEAKFFPEKPFENPLIFGFVLILFIFAMIEVWNITLGFINQGTLYYLNIASITNFLKDKLINFGIIGMFVLGVTVAYELVE